MASQMTPAEARVIDPVLTNIARGYKPHNLVGQNILPVVNVQRRGGKIIEFNKEHFILKNTLRAPGANRKRVQYTYGSASFAIEEHSLAGVVPKEIAEESQEPGVNMQISTVRMTQQNILLEMESEILTAVTTAANYDASNKETLSGTDQWSDYANSVPQVAVNDAKAAVRADIGLDPNWLTISDTVFKKLQSHPDILEAIKNVGRQIANLEDMRAFFGIENMQVAGAMTAASPTGAFTDIMSDFALLHYSNVGSQSEMEPSFGYTYRLDGAPEVRQGRWDDDVDSWIYPVVDNWDVVIAGADGGYLFSDVLA